MLSGLMGALIAVRKTSYAVGEYPTYVITAAQPGAEILWTSWLNGVEQERDQPYGQYIGDDGTLEIRWADPWNRFHIGTWKRTIFLLNPDGTRDAATVTFTVGAAGTVPVVAPAPTQVPPRSTALDPFYKPINRSDTPPRTIYPPYQTPPTIPPIERLPPVYEGPPDILNPAPIPVRPPVLTPVPTQPVPIPAPSNGQIPPRSIYPIGQDIRDPMAPRSTADLPPLNPREPDILNPDPYPTVPRQEPLPSRPETPVSQAPAGPGLGGSVDIGGYQIPIWAIGVALLFALKGR